MASDPLALPVLSAFEPPWKLAARLQIEAVALASRRAQAYAELPELLATCRTPQDLLTQQVMFWQIAQRHYMNGFERLFAPAQSNALPAATVEYSPAKPAERRRDYITVSEAKAAPEAKAAVRDAEPAPASAVERTRVRRSA